jgi:asparagine synthase (glutamine-hydrolysing)
MGILFGVRVRESEVVTEGQMQRLAEATSRYALDGTSVVTRANVGMGFQPYYTHARSKLDSQPVASAQGRMLSFDGRLDNHEDLSEKLELPSHTVPDSEIVLAAFERWGESCFSSFIGDWALALWSNTDRILYLARDHAGARTLYCETAQDRVRWSTQLETFFTDSGRPGIDETYAASYLCSLPDGDRTPLEGIRAVPPAHYLRIDGQNVSRRPHWTCWKARDEIRYRSDDDYAEHFLSLFKQAVTRRSSPGEPAIAQLSGGMDSSSIVCVSDALRKEAGAGNGDLIETISYFDDSEPAWDERPYFTAVERARGREGIHFEASFHSRTFLPLSRSLGEYMWPGADSGSFAREQELFQLLSNKGMRVVLSGIGGDELLGGVPTGTPELADLLVQGRCGALCARAFQWCLPRRAPLLFEMIDTGRSTWMAYFDQKPGLSMAPDWVSARMKKALRSQKSNAPTPTDRFQLLPSQIFASEAWESILRSLPHLQPGPLGRYEFRYPYLDRDLVDFLLAVPRNQLVRPGRRRFMMRNAMKGIVPGEVLERKRKASVQRGPLVALRRNQQTLRDLLVSPRASERGYVDRPRANAALERMLGSSAAREWPSLLRLINVEIWLRGNEEQGVSCI